MEEHKNFILLRNEPEALTMYKDPELKINNQLLNNDKSINNENEYIENQNPNKKNSFKIRISKNLDNNQSQINHIGNKSQQPLNLDQLKPKMKANSIIIPKNTFQNSDVKRVSFNITNNSNQYKNFYLTSQKNAINVKKNNNSSLTTRDTDYMIDRIYKKEIQLCLDLIKKLPENGLKNEKNEKNEKKVDEDKDNKEKNYEEVNNLIELIKKFNFDDINNQKRIEYQILNDNNNNSFDNSNILKSDLNIIDNNLSSLMNSNIKANNFQDNTIVNQNKTNLFMDKNLNNSSMELINNNSDFLRKNSKQINPKLVKSSSTNNISKIGSSKGHFNSKLGKIDLFKNEINFHTGFVRSQKNIYNDSFKTTKRKQIIDPKKYLKKKKEKEKEKKKLLLPEIEEFRSIIKEFQNKKKKKEKKIQDIQEIKKEKEDLDLKDKLIEELKDLYQEQKTTFLIDLQKNFEDEESNKIKTDPIKEEINKNIRNINLVKRKQNYFIDGYSKFTGKINERLDDFNYILGNKFYDKEQKKEKEEKLHKCIEEYENKLKKYRNELINEHKLYKKIYKQKMDFEKDKNPENLEGKNFSFNPKYLYI